MTANDELAATLFKEAAQGDAEALRLAQLRDEVDVRLRFGLITFNAASMVALISALGAAPDFVRSIGLGGVETVGALIAFAFGTIAAGVSMFATQTELITRAGDAGARSIALHTKAEAARTSASADFYQASTTAEKHFLAGLRRSPVPRISQHLSAWAWFLGATVPFVYMLRTLI